MRAWTWLTVALLAASCASPTPTPSATPSSAPTPVLHVGGLARIAADVQPEPVPDDPPDPDIPPLPLEQDELVYLVDGPRQDGDRRLWQVVDDRVSVGSIGWVAEEGLDGRLVLEPFAPACPDIGAVMTTQGVSSLNRIGRLACFGGQPFTMLGPVHCTHAALDYPYGTSAPWEWTNFMCVVGGIDGDGFQVAGDVLYDLALAEPNQLLTGDYVLTAHVDDPAAADCEWIPGTYGYTPLDQPYTDSAVITCRMAVIVTAAEALTSQ
jgi:hypothetical protein